MNALPEATLLLVDDDVDTCRNLYDILSELGFRVDVAHDGLRALELASSTAYDVALLDFKMPGMDGLTLYRALRRLRSSTVAIIVTAFAGSTHEEALQAGAWRVLPKPVDFGGLLALVRQAVEQPLVLVVDDDADLCAGIWDVLRLQGYRVSLAHDEKQAERLLKDASHRAVLIDVRLTHGTGEDIFRLVRTHNPQARTIVITGFRNETEETVRQMMAEGADALCYKPFDVPRLLETLEQLVRRRHSDRSTSESTPSGNTA